ncbi:hypothetical protein SK128_023206 [Halocaridina rubra]|uniref:Uncharacterized protein n=1 Tax=Halocaridina rubra TaxID=373956 RepID=A0AAN8XI85_HALRR
MTVQRKESKVENQTLDDDGNGNEEPETGSPEEKCVEESETCSSDESLKKETENSSINETGNAKLESLSSSLVLNEECKEADTSASNDDEDSEGKEIGDGTSVAIEESTATVVRPKMGVKMTADTGEKPQVNKIPSSEGIALLSQRRAPKRGRNARNVKAMPVVTTAHDNSHQKKKEEEKTAKGEGKNIRNWLRDTSTGVIRRPGEEDSSSND